MAINKTINKRTNSYGAMRNCIEYILREGKTEQHLVHFIGPYPYEKVNYDLVYQSFLAEKRLWGKDSGRMYSHNVISWHKDEKITPEQALEFGIEFAEKWFAGFQTVVSVHKDKDHVHCHVVTNSVSYENGKKLHNSRKDLERIYGRKGEMVLEFHYMEIQLEHGGSVEKLLDSLGRRSGIEDIQNFSQILIQSKKMGGNMRRILQECITSMEEQMDVKKEIQAMLASRRLEQRIMSILPLGIILYLQISSPSFLSVLYGNPAGIGVMTLCLGIYIFAYQWGERLVEIEI